MKKQDSVTECILNCVYRDWSDYINQCYGSWVSAMTAGTRDAYSDQSIDFNNHHQYVNTTIVDFIWTWNTLDTRYYLHYAEITDNYIGTVWCSYIM